MKSFKIWNKNSATYLGTYEGETENEAYENMAEIAGYSSVEELENTIPGSKEDLEFKEVKKVN